MPEASNRGVMQAGVHKAAASIPGVREAHPGEARRALHGAVLRPLRLHRQVHCAATLCGAEMTCVQVQPHASLTSAAELKQNARRPERLRRPFLLHPCFALLHPQPYVWPLRAAAVYEGGAALAGRGACGLACSPCACLSA